MNQLRATIFGFSVFILAAISLVLGPRVVDVKGKIIQDAEHYIAILAAIK